MMTGPVFDREAARQHLLMLAPRGFWSIVWKDVNGGKVAFPARSYTGGEDELSKALDFAAMRHSEGREVYVQVNQAGGVTKIAEKHQIKSVRIIHLDLDSRKAGRDPDADAAWLRDDFMVQPHLIVLSGNGVHAYWLLAEHIAPEESERVCRAVELVCDQDPGCFNCNRVLRLAGTTNFKDRDRPRPVSIFYQWTDAEERPGAYVPAAFDGVVKASEAKERAGKSGKPAEGATVPAISKLFDDKVRQHWPVSALGLELLAELASIDNLNKLNTDIKIEAKDHAFSDRARAIAITGRSKPWEGQQDDPPDNDRSATAIAFAAQALRDGASIKAICSVLISPLYAVSAHVLKPEHTGNRRRPLLRAVAEAICQEHSGERAGRPLIPWHKERWVPAVEPAERALLASGLPVYQRGDTLVEPIRQVQDDGDGAAIRRKTDALRLNPIDRNRMVQLFSKVADFICGKTPTDCPKETASHYLSMRGHWRVRELLGVVEAPTLRSDGSLLQEPGYDARSKIIFDTGGVDFGTIPLDPMKAEAEAALRTLNDLLSGFPFEGEPGKRCASRSVALSLILTALVRRSLPATPLHALTAPTRGTGKTYLGEVAATLATGRSAATMTWPKAADEQRKRLFAALRDGDPVLVLDNVDDVLSSAALCTVVTVPVWTDRVLGVSKNQSVPTCTLIVANGNNLSYDEDMARRVIQCRLDAGVEDPESREFTRNPLREAQERRAELVRAGLVIMRAYIASGEREKVRAYNGFNEWSRMVREPLVWLGEVDPVASRDEVNENDVSRSNRGAAFEALHRIFGHKTFKVADVNKAVERLRSPEKGTDDDRMLGDGLKEAMGLDSWFGIGSQQLKGWFRKHQHQVSNGLVLRKVHKNDDHGADWAIVPTGKRLAEEQEREKRDADYGRQLWEAGDV